MIEMTTKEKAQAIRRCVTGVCNESCPWMHLTNTCVSAMMRAAAEVLEEVGADGRDIQSIARPLRRCATGACKASCPWMHNHLCISTMMQAVAEVLEEVGADD